MVEDYEIITKIDSNSEDIRNQVFSIWRGHIKAPVPDKLLEKRLRSLTLSVLHCPTNKVVGFTTSHLKFYPPLGKHFYFVGLIVLEGYADRPFLFGRTFTHLQDIRSPEAAGVIVSRKNRRISDQMLERYGFSRIKDDLFLRNFE